MSAPAEKARSPAPVSTTTRTSRSASISRQMRLQLALGRRVDGVQHLGPVDGDARDMIGDAEADRHQLAAFMRGAAISAQHLVRVLAEPGRRDADRDRRILEMDRRADDAHALDRARRIRSPCR